MYLCLKHKNEAAKVALAATLVPPFRIERHSWLHRHDSIDTWQPGLRPEEPFFQFLEHGCRFDQLVQWILLTAKVAVVARHDVQCLE